MCGLHKATVMEHIYFMYDPKYIYLRNTIHSKVMQKLAVNMTN